MELRWKASFSTSCLHAAEAVAQGRPLVDEPLQTVVTPAVEAIAQILDGLPADRVWEHVTGLADSIGDNRQLANLALRKALGSPSARQVDELTRAIDLLENAVRRTFPDLERELSLRIGPLRAQWEARGPGLLRQVGRLTDEQVLAPTAEVLIVKPILGGGGFAHHRYNAVRFEGLLANPDDRLPEPVRLAWLLSQLQIDLPRFADVIAGPHLTWLAAIAFLPPVLQAAQDVEWGELSLASLERALRRWVIDRLPAGSGSARETAVSPEILLNWWETFCDTRPPWPVGLAALQRLCQTAGG